MPEQFTFEQAIRNGGAIDVHERTTTSAETVNRARDQFLTRAAFTGDQHRRFAWRHLLDQREYRLHRRIVGGDLRHAIQQRQPALEEGILAEELALFPRPPHECVDLRHAIGLGEIVVGAKLHRRNGCIDRAVTGDDDALGRIRFFPHLPQHREPVHLRHHDVEKCHIVGVGAQCVERRAPIAHDIRLVAAPREKMLENSAEMLFVFGNENLDLLRVVHTPSDAGRITRKVLPLSGTLSTSMRPP